MEFVTVYLPIIVSVLTFGFVIWEKIYPRYSLNAAINQIAFLRVPQNNASSLLRDMLINDLLSSESSEGAQRIIESNRDLKPLIESQDKEALYARVDKIAQHAGIGYDPPDKLVKDYLGDTRYVIPLYVPLVITNSGNRTANISTITLVLNNAKGGNRKWLY